MHVIALRTYPASGEPGLEHATAEVVESGLVGDRPKKAPVSIVGADRAASTRSNIVLDCLTSEVEALVGQVVTIGAVTVVLETAGSTCPGVYAVVGQPGPLALGDALTIVD